MEKLFSKENVNKWIKWLSSVWVALVMALTMAPEKSIASDWPSMKEPPENYPYCPINEREEVIPTVQCWFNDFGLPNPWRFKISNYVDENNNCKEKQEFVRCELP